MRAEIIEQILVKVNGEIFTKTDLEKRQVAALRADGSAVDLKTDARTTRSCARRSTRSRRRFMVDAVDEMLIVQRGKELGYKLSDEQFKRGPRQHQQGKQDRERSSSRRRSKQESMTMADLRKNARAADDRRRACSRDEVLGKVGITEEEARKYYDAHVRTSSRRRGRHAARDPRRSADDRQGVNVAADEAAQGEGRERPQRAARRRGLREARRRSVGRRRRRPTAA